MNRETSLNNVFPISLRSRILTPISLQMIKTGLLRTVN